MMLRGVTGVAAVGVTVLLLTGCDSTDGTTTTPSTTTATLAQDVPRTYSPCTDVPHELIDSEEWKNGKPEDMNGPGGTKWRGCGWVKRDGYAVAVSVTNVTIEMVRDRKLPDTREFTVDGRRAISSRQSSAQQESQCTVNAELRGGSLEIFLDNPPSNKATGKSNTCDLAVELAGKIVPTIPDGA